MRRKHGQHPNRKEAGNLFGRFAVVEIRGWVVPGSQSLAAAPEQLPTSTNGNQHFTTQMQDMQVQPDPRLRSNEVARFVSVRWSAQAG
jgi:hypothetical protein